MLSFNTYRLAELLTVKTRGSNVENMGMGVERGRLEGLTQAALGVLQRGLGPRLKLIHCCF